MGFTDSSLLIKIALGISGVGLLFDLIGLAAPYWLIFPGGNGYLFQSCSDRIGCGSIPSSLVTSDLAAAQAMSIIGFLFGIAVVVLIVLYMIMNKTVLRLGGLILSFVAAGFILIGVIIAGTNRNGFDIGWAMILAIIGALFYIASGVVLVVDLMNK